MSGRYSSDAVWYTHIHSAWYFIGSQCVGAPFLSCIINPKSFLFNLVRFNSSYLNKDYLKRKTKKIPSRKAIKVSLGFFFPPDVVSKYEEAFMKQVNGSVYLLNILLKRFFFKKQKQSKKKNHGDIQ